MNWQSLKETVYETNIALWKSGLVVLTWGNVSAVDDSREIMAIKPSGVPYETMKPDDIVLIELSSGKPTERSALRPSSDAPTHRALYRAWPDVGGVAHTHSRSATAFAQARRDIPCLGTTHADTFCGAVRCTRPLSPEETARDYEGETGLLIVRELADTPPLQMPAILLGHHGPFTWGKTARDAVEHAIVLEEVAAMALSTFALCPDAEPCPAHILEKHHQRKHGANAYYGQGERR